MGNTLTKHIQRKKANKIRNPALNWRRISAVNRINATKFEAINHHRRRRHIRVYETAKIGCKHI